MKTIHKVSVFIILVMMTLTSCGSTAYYGNLSGNKFNQDEVKTKNIQNLPLVDYLRRVPGLTVSGYGANVDISIRGLATINGVNSPLYVIDNDPIGNNYNQAASMVDTNDIKSVLVLKDAVSTTSYGTRGSNGVIMIKTKKQGSKS
jgi:TonB-dependent SusC/RagA subfamily outer membrane receptor